jgi:hypothetical protein
VRACCGVIVNVVVVVAVIVTDIVVALSSLSAVARGCQILM